MKSFSYVNLNGFNKILNVFPEKTNEENEYYIEIWTGQNDTMEATGMFCGCGYWSIEELNDFLAYYKINYKF